ncbi:MAG: hypothetical protein WC683_05890 [bacterium]
MTWAASFWTKVQGWFAHLRFRFRNCFNQTTIQHQTVIVIARCIEEAGKREPALIAGLKADICEYATLTGVEGYLNQVVKSDVESAVDDEPN